MRTSHTITSTQTLAQHLADRLGVVPPPTALSSTIPPTTPNVIPVYITGMASCSAQDILHTSPLATLDTVRPVPLSRWNVDAPGVPRFAAMLSDDCVASIDTQAFGVAPSEAVLMDPQQRLLLQTTVHALAVRGEDSRGGTLHPQVASFGTYVGIASSDYASLVQRMAGDIGTSHATATAISVAAGRLAFVLGMSGPCMAIDTACSSSLVAMHAAVGEMVAGRLQGATVSGVHLQCTATSSSYVYKAGMLSPVGRCQVHAAGF